MAAALMSATTLKLVLSAFVPLDIKWPTRINVKVKRKGLMPATENKQQKFNALFVFHQISMSAPTQTPAAKSA